MQRINVKAKGAKGERELSRFLKLHLDLDFDPERNLEQTRSGGGDIVNVYPFLFECKRVETLNLQDWWIQAKHAASRNGAIPVVAFRQNRKNWEFLISATWIDLPLGYLRLEQKTFVEWAKLVINDRQS